jgi:hypothetical protein
MMHCGNIVFKEVIDDYQRVLRSEQAICCSTACKSDVEAVLIAGKAA